MVSWYRVEVSDHDGQIVAIEPEMLCGRDIGDAERATIQAAIDTLAGFIGQPNFREMYANEAHAKMMLMEHYSSQETRIEEAVAVCSACGVSGSGGLASGGSTVTIRCNKPCCPGGTSANRRV